jgi:hypothetical protein
VDDLPVGHHFPLPLVKTILDSPFARGASFFKGFLSLRLFKLQSRRWERVAQQGIGIERGRERRELSVRSHRHTPRPRKQDHSPANRLLFIIASQSARCLLSSSLFFGGRKVGLVLLMTFSNADGPTDFVMR